MKTIGIILLCLSAVGFLGLFLLTYANEAQNNVDEVTLSAKTELECTNNPFKGEVLLVTFVDKPLAFHCEVKPSEKIPEGYLPAPTEFKWSVSSGKIETKNDRCFWKDASSGVQTIKVEGSLTYLPPKKTGLFEAAKPKIEIPFQAHMKCLFPVDVGNKMSGYINQFPIGTYPDPTDPKDLNKATIPSRIKNNIEAYTPPSLYYKVTPETFFLNVFDNYRLGDFDLDPHFKDMTYPRYIAVHPKVLKKMDLLKRLMNSEGVKVTKFNIIYLYRSPNYNLTARDKDGNKSLKSAFSSHMYGRAVDFIVDENHDWVIDDLNEDGKIDIADARKLRSYVDMLDNHLLKEDRSMVGGAFTYYHHDFWERGDYVQTPYVHMDVRAHTREDGSLIRDEFPDTIGITRKQNPYKQKKPIPPLPFSNNQ